jgi:putative inorganic carbon (HCO3(-)) transporter
LQRGRREVKNFFEIGYNAFMGIRKIFFIFFSAFFFLIPLTLWPYTSEIFEFNKMLLTYVFTVFIFFTWVLRCLTERKLIFRRTLLDLPLLAFLLSQLISTLLSIDYQTSLYGYYSRFNGGFMSVLSYSVLYWAFVSNMERVNALRSAIWLFISAALVSIYGVLQHFGIDKEIWVQDVQSRVFSTLGQPNWLAAWLVALIPLAWAFSLKEKFMSGRFIFYGTLSLLFFWTVIYTKSRSGLAGFAVAFLVFVMSYAFTNFKKIKTEIKKFSFLTAFLIGAALISGTQFTPKLSDMLSPAETETPQVESAGPALEVGGTESGTIRKIVWKGAFQIWKAYPVFGTGVETFAFSYYGFRPKEHNLVSEWDFIYNKAHNEYLNIAANTGTFGLLTYIVLLGMSVLAIIKGPKNDDDKIMRSGLLAGYLSLTVTNFFGFSVVPTQVLLFIFPGIGILLSVSDEKIKDHQINGKYGIILALLSLVFLNSIYTMWKADLFYSSGKQSLESKQLIDAEKKLMDAIELSPKNSLFHNDLAMVYTLAAQALNEQGQTEQAKTYAAKAISESALATGLSPANVNLLRSRFGIFVMLTAIDKSYLKNAGEVLLVALQKAPTDAKLYYNLSLFYAQIGEKEKALDTLKTTIELKENYKDARLAYAILLNESGNKEEAREQLEFILKFIDPKDSITQQTLESL